MAHPLNRPVFDAATQRVRRRLRHPAAARRRQPAERQPLALRATVRRRRRASIPTRARSRTSTRTCSAKARSSARASTTSTPSSRRWRGRFPENRILSHDLLEGCYARSALVSDVELSRSIPPRYLADVQPPPPLDARRLADRALAAAARARAPAGRRVAQSALGCCRAGRSSTTCGAACAAALLVLLVLGLDRCSRRARVLDAVRARRSWSLPALLRVAAGAGLAGRADSPWSHAPAGSARAAVRHAAAASAVHARVPAVRGLRQPRRDRAHVAAHAVSRAGKLLRMDRPSSDAEPAAATTLAGVLRSDVDRAGARPLAVARASG